MKTNRIRYVLLSTVIMALFACQGEMSEQLEKLNGQPTTKAALVEATVKVETAGTFVAELEKVIEGGLKSVQKLTISGKFDAEDVGNLRKMAQLEELDISGITFVESDKMYSVSYEEYRVEVNTISSCMFTGLRKMRKIVLPNTIVAIKDRAFQNCSALAGIEIPGRVTLLGNYLFYECSSLLSVIIPNSVLSMGTRAFMNCTNLKEVQFSENIGTISDEAFWGCSSLSSITIPNSVTSIGGGAFYGCSSLSSITIPNSITSIGEGTFCRSGLKDVKLSESINSIAGGTFSNCYSLCSITIPKSVITIGERAFEYCSNLSKVDLSEGLINIIQFAFERCTKLTTIDIPNTVAVVGPYAFGSTGLKTLTIPASVTSVSYDHCISDNVTSVFWYSAAPVPVLSRNANVLLYLSSEVDVSRSGCSNIILNGVAQKIVITEGSPYECPSAYKTKKISFIRNFSKSTVPESSAGWYTLALPFDVQTITYNNKDIAPFAKEGEAADTKRFWLRELTATHYKKDVVAIKKDQPYIIAMPNSSAYDDEFNIRGNVTFSATNSVQGIDMPVTSELPIIKGAEYSMKGTYEWVAQGVKVYPINDAGTAFEPSIRAVSPFEAYVINNDLSAPTRSFSIGNSNVGTRAFRSLSRKPSNNDM